MWKDPIVQEVRNAGEQLAQTANYKIEKFFENLRKNEKALGLKVVSKSNYQDGAVEANRT